MFAFLSTIKGIAMLAIAAVVAVVGVVLHRRRSLAKAVKVAQEKGCTPSQLKNETFMKAFDAAEKKQPKQVKKTVKKPVGRVAQMRLKLGLWLLGSKVAEAA